MDTCFGLSHPTRNQVAPRRASHPCRRHCPLRGEEGSSRSRARSCPRPRCCGRYFHSASGQWLAPGRCRLCAAALPGLSAPRCAQGVPNRRFESCGRNRPICAHGEPPRKCQLRAQFCEQSRVSEVLAQYGTSTASAAAQSRACRESSRDRGGRHVMAMEKDAAHIRRLGAARQCCTRRRSA